MQHDREIVPFFLNDTFDLASEVLGTEVRVIAGDTFCRCAVQSRLYLWIGDWFPIEVFRLEAVSRRGSVGDPQDRNTNEQRDCQSRVVETPLGLVRFSLAITRGEPPCPQCLLI